MRTPPPTGRGSGRADRVRRRNSDVISLRNPAGLSPPYIDVHAGDRTVRWVHLFELDLTSTLRWTDDQLPVMYGGQTYVPYVVSADAIATEQGQIAGASLSIGNADNAFGAFLFASDITGSVIKVWQAWLDPLLPGQVPQDVRQVFIGRISSVAFARSGADSIVRLTLGPYADPSTKLLPARTVADLLRH